MPFPGYSQQDPADSVVYRLSTDPGARLSEHFAVSEMACRDGTDILLVHPALVELLEDIRTHFGAPCIINSGWRSHAYNLHMGGAKNSRHLFGMAADIDVVGVTPVEVWLYAQGLQVGGLGRYHTFTHVDVQGQNRRWDMR